MNLIEIVKTAIGNTFRSKLRTVLTVLAIFVGAFTLTLTNGLGTGITHYIDAQVATIGGADLMSVTKASNAPGGGFGAQDGPQPYDPDKSFVSAGGGFQFEALTQADLEAIAAIPDVTMVEPIRMALPDYIGVGSAKYELSVSPAPSNFNVDLAAGRIFDTDGTSEVAGYDQPLAEMLLPLAYVEPLGFASSQDAVGEVVTIAVSNPFGKQQEVAALITGVQQSSLFGDSVTVSKALLDELFAAQTSGLPKEVTNVYQGARAYLAKGSSDAQVNAIKEGLAAEGLFGITLADQLGMFNTVIDAIIGVLNAFAIIALIAAGFGIINTLLMSVQERTREIGLMKAMGMGAGRIFTLFSAEAVFIGFLGSAIGSVVAIIFGSIISDVLANGPLKDLAGLRILSFDPASVAIVIVVVMALAFVAGTLPAGRAARQNPIEALRYE